MVHAVVNIPSINLIYIRSGRAFLFAISEFTIPRITFIGGMENFFAPPVEYINGNPFINSVCNKQVVYSITIGSKRIGNIERKEIIAYKNGGRSAVYASAGSGNYKSNGIGSGIGIR